MLPAVYICGRPIAMYGLCIVCGALSAGLVALALGRRCALAGEDIVLCGLYLAVGGVIGGKLLYLLAHLQQLLQALRAWPGRPELLLSLLQGGFLFFGGLAGGLFMFWRYCSAYRVDMGKMARCIIPVAPLVQAWGRVGCFCAGCCYGIPWDGPLAVSYSLSPVAPLGQALFPVQLVSAGLNLLLCAALLLYVSPRPQLSPRRLALLYVAVYCLGRLVLDFWRGDHTDRTLLDLTWAQWACLLILPAILIIMKNERAKSKGDLGTSD